MSTTDKNRNRLITLLKELFQLDQPELDFGLYKIMHAKSEQITKFLQSDLLKEIEAAFGEVDQQHAAEAKAKYEAAIEQAKKFGAPNPDETPGVQEAKSAYENAKDSGNAENEIYDHLYRFFERYYDSGDFMSRRYYARESDSRAAPYSVPYDGREVYLHWANKDQYYIKSTEYLSNYSFELNAAIRQEAQKTKGAGLEAFATREDETELKVHFRIIEASEGEHGNIKAASDQKRFFHIHKQAPILLENGELVIQFEYRIDNDKPSKTQDRIWQESRLLEAEVAILNALKEDTSATGFLQGLSRLAPTDSKAKRTLLGKYLYQYTARNTMDYFIHKDLGGFMRRELDFYIKNEIMRLDDIDNADAPKVEQYLAQIRVLRRIAQQLIAFLSQLEDFQKKLWLKKKFVTETHYCITLDRVPVKFYAEIAANEKQLNEWEKLFAISEINDSLLASQPASQPAKKCTPEFLKNNPFLLLDTALFSNEFKQQLLAELPDLDAQCDGVLIHSENFQALGLMQQKYREQVKCIYIDPPYNTGGDGFTYKDAYQHSSWLSMLYDRVYRSSFSLKTKNGVFLSSISEEEVSNYKLLLNLLFSGNVINAIATRRQDKNLSLQFVDKGLSSLSVGFEYILSYRKSSSAFINPVYTETSEDRSTNGYWKGFWNDADRPTMRYDISGFNPTEGQWKWKEQTAKEAVDNYKLYLEEFSAIESLEEYWIKTGCKLKFIKRNLAGIGKNKGVEHWIPPSSQKLRSTDWTDLLTLRAISNDYALTFSSPKNVELIENIIAYGANCNSLVLDYFAGSGTTGHAVINLNREDNGNRKYILVEQNNYFDTVLKPRIQKVVYSKDWKDGKPVSREGISHCFKTLRLESYEDTLNNLVLKADSSRDMALANNAGLQRDYLLNYFLDVETQASQSLLNIADFRDPTAYKMNIKKPGSEEQRLQAIDLIETFNWLIGLWVQNMAAPHSFSAEFEREQDPDLPKDQNTRLTCKRLKVDNTGDYWFRLIEGYTLKVPGDNTSKVATLIIWRKQTDDAEKDNAVLQKFLLEKLQISPRAQTYGVIYINGSHTLPNPVVEGEQTKVRLIEEAFHNAMWSGDAS